MVRRLLCDRHMLPSRWSHLARYGLLGTSLVGASATTARAEPCDDFADGTLNVVVGVQISPDVRILGGVEARRCLNDQTEGMVRFEVGGGAPRFIVGARARPFESWERDSDLEYLGFEAGGFLDTQAKLGLHLASTFGIHAAYLALQARIKINEQEQPTRWTILGGLAPWTLADQSTVVEGRPLSHGGSFLKPRLARHLPVLRSAEARAARDHFVSSAQLELSSVWTFLRLASELAAVGAPAHLIASALDAADDEVRHAMACAGAAGGLALLALPPEAAQPRFTARSAQALAMLAAEAWCEGCLNETAAAEEARIVATATSGDRRTMLETIARDESGHAELSWAVLAWIYSIAPDVARASLAAVPPAEMAVLPHVDHALARHGVPTEYMTAAARAHAARVAHVRLAELAA
jgi:hypothetical protein